MIVGNDLQRIWIVWLTFLIAEGLSVMIAMRFMRKIRLQKVEGMKDFHAELAHGNMVTRTS